MTRGYLLLLLTLTVLCIWRRAEAACGCLDAADTCGFMGGVSGFPPPGDITVNTTVCADCSEDVDHCGLCMGCQIAFITQNVTASSLVTGNRIGSLAAISMRNPACSQFHSPAIVSGANIDVWSWSEEPAPAPPLMFVEFALTNIKQAPRRGYSGDASDSFLLIGNLLSNPKLGHFFAKTNPFPPFQWLFDLVDPCGGNQYAWDVAVDEESGFMFVSDPKAFFTGRVWIHQVTSPFLFGNLSAPGASTNDLFGYNIDAHDGFLVASRINCNDGVPAGGCLHFFHYDVGLDIWLPDNVIVNGPSPSANDRLGWRVTISKDFAFAGFQGGDMVEVYDRSGTTWTHFQTLLEPNPSSNNLFGWAMQVRDGTLAIGDENYLVSGSARGKVFTYRLQGGSWQLWSTYTDAVGSFNTRFGADVDLSDDFLLVGIPGAPPHGKCMLIDRDVSPCFSCDDVYNSCGMFDSCGVCFGDDSTCLGCDNIPGSGKVNDSCGVCAGNNDSCIVIDPTAYAIPCHSNQSLAMECTSFFIQTDFNDSLATNFTLNTPPLFGDFSLNIVTGNFTYCPPLEFEGPVMMNVTACYVETPAIVPPECGDNFFEQIFDPCKDFVPPGPVLACTTEIITILVLPCVGCDLMVSSGLILDLCLVCGGDGTSCLDCLGIVNGGAVIDYCGQCAGSNSSCLDLFPPPILAGPCDPFYFIHMAWEPMGNVVSWKITVPPTFGTASIGMTNGVIAYNPPDDFMGVGPFDSLTVKAKDAFGNMASVTLILPMAFFVPDACGLCNGDNSSCLDCFGVPNGGAVLDGCNVCNGDGTTCGFFIETPCGWICAGIAITPFLIIALILLCLYGFCRNTRVLRCAVTAEHRNSNQIFLPPYYINPTTGERRYVVDPVPAGVEAGNYNTDPMSQHKTYALRQRGQYMSTSPA